MTRATKIRHAAARLCPEWATVRAILALLFICAIGTGGFMWLEGWSAGQSIFFTVITLTTIGYGDYGLSATGQYFTTGLVIVGLSTMAYYAGHILPGLFNTSLYRKRKMMHQIMHLQDHFIVCGLGRIGKSVCARLSRENVSFVVIDADEKAVESAREHGLLAIEGDATEDHVLEQLGIHQARGLVCVTSSDTENIVITLGARELNPDLMIISRAEEDDALRKLQRAGATRVVSPSHSSGQSIVNTILKPHVADLLDRSNHVESGFSFCEVEVSEDSPLAGRTIGACGEHLNAVVLVAIKPVDGPLRIRPADDHELRAGDVLIVAGEHEALNGLHETTGIMRSAA